MKHINVGGEIITAFSETTGSVRLYINEGTLRRNWAARTGIQRGTVHSIETTKGMSKL